MDHDSSPFDLPGPVSYRAADVRKTYKALTLHGLSVMDEKVSHDAAYSSNHEGHFAWDLSLLVRAACLTWRATGDTAYLKQSLKWAQHMMERTDEARGIKDWRGAETPIWSAGPRYTAGSAIVGSIGGAQVRIQAASSRLIVERPSSDTVVVHSIRDDGDLWTSQEASLLPHSDNYLPDVLSRHSSTHAVLVRGLNEAIDLRFISSGEHEVLPVRAGHLVHTGMIARSLITAAEALGVADKASGLSEVSPGDLVDAAHRALQSHNYEMRVKSNQPWFVTDEEFPGRRLGLELPHNHIADVATSCLVLGRKFQDVGYHRLGVSLIQPMLDEIAMYISGDLPHPWFYYPTRSRAFSGVAREHPIAERRVPPVKRAEDSSHATMRVRALLEWRAIDPSLVSVKELRAISRTFHQNYLTTANDLQAVRWLPTSPESVADGVRLGRSNTYAGAWAGLSRWDPTMRHRINLLAYEHPPLQIFGATVLSAAEILAMNSPSTVGRIG